MQIKTNGIMSSRPSHKLAIKSACQQPKMCPSLIAGKIKNLSIMHQEVEHCFA
jgi:hypothetical protein